MASAMQGTGFSPTQGGTHQATYHSGMGRLSWDTGDYHHGWHITGKGPGKPAVLEGVLPINLFRLLFKV